MLIRWKLKRHKRSATQIAFNMNIENTKRIINACSSLFSTMGDEQERLQAGEHFTPIAFGFECGDGWADLLIELCTNIQSYFNTLPKHISEDIVALQVKEKYGILKFNIKGGDSHVKSIISYVEYISGFICEKK